MFGPSTSANFGNSTIDWGFLGALAGRKNFDALKQEKLREVALVDQQNNILQNRVAQNEAAQQGVSRYLDTINQLKVLPQGLERIKEVDKSLRENITKGIMDSKGDVRKWLMSGGTKVLNEYKNNLVNNEVTRREIGNAYQTNKWLADKQAGLQEEYSFDEKGTPITFQDQYQKYQKGEIDKLDYKGAFKLPEYITSIPDRYAYMDKEKAKWADEKDVFNDAYQKFKDLPENQRKQAAWHHAMEYVKQVKSGAAPYQFKVDQRDPLKDKLYNSQIAKNNSGVAKDRAAIGAMSMLKNRLTEIAKGNVRVDGYQPFKDENGNEIGKLPYISLDANNNTHVTRLAGFKTDENGMLNKQSMLQLKNMVLLSVLGGNIDLSKVSSESFLSANPTDNRVYMQKDANGVTVPMKMITVKIDERGAEKATYDGKKFEDEGWFTSTTNLPHLTEREANFNIRPFNYNDGVITTNVLVPIKNNIFTGVEDFNEYSSKMKNENMGKYSEDASGDLQDIYQQINIMTQ